MLGCGSVTFYQLGKCVHIQKTHSGGTIHSKWCFVWSSVNMWQVGGEDQFPTCLHNVDARFCVNAAVSHFFSFPLQLHIRPDTKQRGEVSFFGGEFFLFIRHCTNLSNPEKSWERSLELKQLGKLVQICQTFAEHISTLISIMHC